MVLKILQGSIFRQYHRWLNSSPWPLLCLHSQTADTSHFGTCKLLLSNQNLRFYDPWLTELGPVGSFCLWELGGGGGADDFTTDHAASQGQGQLPSSPIPALSISESAELVSFPHCKHNTKQGNNEAAYLDKTCFPAECHYVLFLCS